MTVLYSKSSKYVRLSSRPQLCHERYSCTTTDWGLSIEFSTCCLDCSQSEASYTRDAADSCFFTFLTLSSVRGCVLRKPGTETPPILASSALNFSNTAAAWYAQAQFTHTERTAESCHCCLQPRQQSRCTTVIACCIIHAGSATPRLIVTASWESAAALSVPMQE